MKRKILKMCSGIVLTVALTVTSMIHYDSQVTAADQVVPGVIKVAPENMLNVQVVDKNGNPVDNISASLKNTSGSTVASWTIGSQEVNDVSGIGITGNTYFDEPIETFKKLVAPCSLTGISDFNNFEDLYSGSEDSVRFNAGKNRYLKLDYKIDYTTALTVPANEYAVIVDPKWSSRDERLFLKANQNELILSQIAGTKQCYQFNEQSELLTPKLELGGHDISISRLSKTDLQKEYIKVHFKLSDIGSIFHYDGTYTVGYSISGNGIDDTRYIDYNFVKEEINDSGSMAMGILCIQSGTVMNFPIPDSDGYVDIYVEKSSRKIVVDVTRILMLNNEENLATSSILKDTSKYGTGAAVWTIMHKEGNDVIDSYDYSSIIKDSDSKIYTLQAVDFPDEGTTLSNVPAGNYTLELSNVPQQYKQPSVQNVTITESQDVQMLKIVLEDPHTHTADESRWLSDISNHWHKCSTCDEDVKLDSVAHTPGAEATEDSTQICTVCGYEIAPKLEHVHDYGDTYKTDADNHWKECRCGDVSERATHDFTWVTDKEATESEDGSKHEECTICGYKKDTVEIPALKPIETPTQKTEQPTQKQEPTTQKQSSEKQSTPVTGDNISSTFFVLIIASIILFVAVIIVGGRKKVLENEDI